jgi:hypothetical protein
LSFFPVDVEDLLIVDDAFVVLIKLGDELAQLELLKVNVEPLKSSFQVVNADLSVAVIVEILDGSTAVGDIFLGEKILHSSIMLLIFYWHQYTPQILC